MNNTTRYTSVNGMLEERHRRMLLEESGIHPDVAVERGYRTIRHKADIPSAFADVQRKAPALLIPVCSPDGTTRFYRIRPDRPRVERRENGNGIKERAIKYEQPARQRIILDVHPRNVERIKDAGEDLWVTEGEKKADALTSRELCAVALFGVDCWGRGGELLPCWRHVALDGRKVYIVYDSDITEKREVQDALRRLVKALSKRGAKVYVVHLPGPEKGVDDFLAGGGTVGELYELAAPFKGNGHGHPERTFNLTDTGNAERLIARHGEDLHYVYAWRSWLVWTGRNWKVDDTGEVQRRAKDTAISVYGEAEKASDSSTRRALADHAKRSEARTRIEAMMALAQSEVGVPALVNDLDADPWLLNVSNGTLDLRTGELQEHRREDLITKLAPVEYDPEARAPEWEAFLERILPSEELQRFVQRVMGYSLTGDVSEQILPFLYGTGANGKSTLINTFLSILGDYGQQAAPELLLSKRGTHPTELADLLGARFVASVEIEDGRRMAESLVKQLTGGEKIKARYLHKDFFEFAPTHKVFLAANHKPEIQGTDHAIWRRVKLLPFEVTIPDEEQDPRLPEKLQVEFAGILAWAVRGCLEWQREGLNEPDEVRAATEEYRAEQDVLADFLKERCVIRPGVWCRFADLYEAYEEWCEESGEKPETKRKLSSRLKERGFPPKNGTDNVAIRNGIALRHDPDPDSSRINEREQDPGPTTRPEGPSSENRRDSINEPASNVNPQNPCKTEANDESINHHYPENGNSTKNTLTREVSEQSLMNINSLIRHTLSEEERDQVEALVKEGVQREYALAEVLGDKEVF